MTGRVQDSKPWKKMEPAPFRCARCGGSTARGRTMTEREAEIREFYDADATSVGRRMHDILKALDAERVLSEERREVLERCDSAIEALVSMTAGGSPIPEETALLVDIRRLTSNITDGG